MLNLTRRNALLTTACAGAAFGLPKPVSFIEAALAETGSEAGKGFSPFEFGKLGLVAAGGLLGALAASSCCLLPLVLFFLGVSGAWIGNLTRLAPYHPYFIVVTALCLVAGYWLVYRSGTRTCVESGACALPLQRGVVKGCLVIATALVAAALGLDFFANFLQTL